MTPRIVSDLHAIASKPGVSPSTLLIVSRRTCRILIDIRDRICWERNNVRRTAVKAGRDLPRSASDLEMLEDLAATHRDDEYKYVRARLVEFGSLLSADGSNVAGRLGFDRLCDILNVNPIRRAQIPLSHRKPLRRLIHDESAEDSAEVGRHTLAQPGPLCGAIYASYADGLLRKCLAAPEHPVQPE
jgi:hypothetical protein